MNIENETNSQTIQGRILKLVDENDPILKQPSEEFDFESKTFEEVQQLYFDMVETMRYNNGIGLSAIQVGLPIRLFVMDTGGEYPEALFNPKIVNQGGQEVTLEEGCLSFPDMWVKVKRSSRVRIRYQLLNGETVTKEFVGLSARCALHEYDHLDGLTMKNKANKIHWDSAINKRKIIRRRRKG